MRRHRWHDTAEVRGVIEGEPGAAPLQLARHLTHVERGHAPEALRALRLPGRPGVAYLAGEARTIQALRRVLIDERGWDRRQILSKPFWTPGRTGMD